MAAGQSTAVPGDYSSTLSGADVDFYTLILGSNVCSNGTRAPTPTATNSFNVLASPPAYCTLSTGSLSFGAQGVISSNKDATTAMTIRCSNTLPYSVALGNGVTGTGPTARKMTNGGASITYGLYRDSGRSQAWGSTSGVDQAAGTGTGADQVLTVYGRVPTQTTPAAGTYSDTVAVAVTY